MPKSGFTYKSNVKGIKHAILRGAAKATRDTAKGIAKGAKERVPSPQNTGPYATGALQASIHVVDATPKSTGGERSGYAAAKAAALAANPKVVVEPELPVAVPDPAVLVCAVDEPVEYAERVEKGGFDMSAGYRAPGPHLEPAKNEEEPKFNSRLGAALREIETKFSL